MRSIGRYIFRIIIFSPFALLIVYVLALTPIYDFNWWFVLFMSACGAWFNPKSNFAWKLILENYEKPVPGISMLVTEIGDFRDKHEDYDQGFFIFTSVSEDGLILYKGHVIPFLRETAVIPWKNIKAKKLIDRTPISKDGLVDQNSKMLMELRIKGVAVPLEIPWNKEIELYTNILSDRRENGTANK